MPFELNTAAPGRTVERIDEETLRALPKAEVHVHLEGSFELVDLVDLAKAAGSPLPGPARSLFDMSTHYAPDTFEVTTGTSTGTSTGLTTGGGAASGVGVSGLSGFLQFLDWQCGLITTPEQAARHAYRFAARESASGIRYADAIVNPTHWSAWRDRVPALFDAFANGLGEAESDGFATVNLCVSILRQQSAAEGVQLAEWVVAEHPDRVVALSIDGDERAAGGSGARFAEAFTVARDAGIHRTVHAGESSGPDRVWDAVRHLHAERIDHGVRSVEDPSLVAFLADSSISLGICPRSNMALGIYSSWAEHPLPRLRDAGVTVTINTDDPAPLGTRLEAEWALCAELYGWGLADMVGFAEASVRASFAPEELKAQLLGELAGAV